MKHWSRKTIFPDPEARKFKDHKWSFKALVSALIKRLESEKDNLIIVSGSVGSGKSHFTGALCLKHFAKIPNFITGEGMMFEKENFVIDPEEFAAKMITKPGSVIWNDESRASIDRQNWHQKINQLIIQRKNTNRKKFQISFLLLPFEAEINPRMSGHATAWFYVRRGVVEIFVANSKFKGGKGLNIHAMLEKETKWKKENPQSEIIPPYIHNEFIGKIYFRELTPGYKAEYDKLVEEKHAAGQLSDEEKMKFGLVENMTPETYIKNTIKDIVEGSIKDKKYMWEKLRTQTGLPDNKLLKQLNFYLKLDGLPTFNKLKFN